MSQTTPSQPALALLTTADIIRLKHEYEADLQLLEDLPARIKLRKRRYEAALLFAPEGFDPDQAQAPTPPATTPTPDREPEVSSASPVAPPLPFVWAASTRLQPPAQSPNSVAIGRDEDEGDSSDSDGKITWVGELARILENEQRGLSHKEALSLLLQTDLAARATPENKGFYGAIAKLESKGQLVKGGGLLYSPKVVQALRDAGQELPDMSASARRRGGATDIAVKVMREHPGGHTSPELRVILAACAEMPDSIRKHKNYIHNLLGEMVKQNLIYRDDQGKYHVKEKEE